MTSFNRHVTTALLSGALLAVLGSGRAEAAACSAAQGQQYIDAGQYDKAVKEFSCLIDAQPTELEGYRGRIEAELLLGQFSYAVRDYARITAVVIPVHPDAPAALLDAYKDRLAATPDDVPALTGAGVGHWWYFDYASAIHILTHLLDVQPASLAGTLIRGSSQLLKGVTTTRGIQDIENAIAMAPQNPHVHFIVADAYTYGLPDAQRAFNEALQAMAGGLDTPRLRAILANCYQVFGDVAAAAMQIAIHIQMVTTQLVTTTPLPAGTAMALDLVAGRTFDIPVAVGAGETLEIATSSPTHEIWDSILVLLAPDGTPVVGADDTVKYFAGLDWVAPTSGTYRLRVTSFEAVSTGQLRVTRR